MKYGSQVLVSRRLIRETNLNDEHFFRELASAIIKDTPFKELQKIFKFTKSDVFIWDGSEVKYQAEIEIPDYK